MTEKKMTRVQAIEFVLTNCEIPEEVREPLAKMAVSLAKPRSKQEGPTKTQRENMVLADALVAKMGECGEPVTAKWVTEHVAGITTPQKVVAVVKVAGDRVVKFYEGRKTFYRLA